MLDTDKAICSKCGKEGCLCDPETCECTPDKELVQDFEE